MTDDIRALALLRLTNKQWEVFNLVHQHGLSMRTAALYCGISRSAAVDRYDAAVRNMHRAGVRFTPDGRPYLEVTT